LEENKVSFQKKLMENWQGLDNLQTQVLLWEKENFPDSHEWEFALGTCEEAGELAQCVLKLHRKMRESEFNEARLQDAIGDIVIYLFGICGKRNWKLSEILEVTSEKVLSRKWKL
jgi:NTP pyrophosphatase (non-canonical NTP hydrolase)